MIVNIQFVNGSTAQIVRQSYLEAQRYCRDHISYTGNRVKRVEIIDPYGSKFAIWDVSWDEVSKAFGLSLP